MKLCHALATLDLSCMDMGDSPAEHIEALMFCAGISNCTYEKDSDFVSLAEMAYETILSHETVSFDALKENIPYYVDCQERLKFEYCMEIQRQHSSEVLKSLHCLQDEVKKNNRDDIDTTGLEELISCLDEVNIPLVRFAYQVSHEYWRYLDKEKGYFISNTCFQVGSLLHKGPEINETVFGQYTCHCKSSKSNVGYYITFVENDGEYAVDVRRYFEEIIGSVVHHVVSDSCERIQLCKEEGIDFNARRLAELITFMDESV